MAVGTAQDSSIHLAARGWRGNHEPPFWSQAGLELIFDSTSRDKLRTKAKLLSAKSPAQQICGWASWGRSPNLLTEAISAAGKAPHSATDKLIVLTFRCILWGQMLVKLIKRRSFILLTSMKRVKYGDPSRQRGTNDKDLLPHTVWKRLNYFITMASKSQR